MLYAAAATSTTPQTPTPDNSAQGGMIVTFLLFFIAIIIIDIILGFMLPEGKHAIYKSNFVSKYYIRNKYKVEDTVFDILGDNLKSYLILSTVVNLLLVAFFTVGVYLSIKSYDMWLTDKKNYLFVYWIIFESIVGLECIMTFIHWVLAISGIERAKIWKRRNDEFEFYVPKEVTDLGPDIFKTERTFVIYKRLKPINKNLKPLKSIKWKFANTKLTKEFTATTMPNPAILYYWTVQDYDDLMLDYKLEITYDQALAQYNKLLTQIKK